VTEPAVPPPPTRRLGDLEVSAVGLGCMPLSENDMLDHRERAVATVHAALDAGVTLLDTADIYAPSWDRMNHNEALVGEALRSYAGDAARVVVVTKGGNTRGPGETWGRDARAGALRSAAQASCQALGVDALDVYLLHRHDPSLTYAEQVRNLAAVRDAGLARRIGLSNCTRDELQVALEEVGGPADGGIVAVQNERSPRYRADSDVLDLCTELGIAYLPWSPLGGAEDAPRVGSAYAAFAEVGRAHGASAQETVVAWLLGQSPVLVCIPGARRAESIRSSVRAASLALAPEERELLDATVPSDESVFPDHGPRSPLR
jgi:aryl-alcohol dehydrogenase-like predicted oxidoreductase